MDHRTGIMGRPAHKIGLSSFDQSHSVSIHGSQAQLSYQPAVYDHPNRCTDQRHQLRHFLQDLYSPGIPVENFASQID